MPADIPHRQAKVVGEHVFKFRRSSERSILRSVVLALLGTLLVPVVTVLAPIAPASALVASDFTANTFLGMRFLNYAPGGANSHPVGFRICSSSDTATAVSARFEWVTPGAGIETATGTPESHTVRIASDPLTSGSCADSIWQVTTTSSVTNGRTAQMKVVFTLTDATNPADQITVSSATQTLTLVAKSANPSTSQSQAISSITLSGTCATVNETCTVTAVGSITGASDFATLSPVLPADDLQLVSARLVMGSTDTSTLVVPSPSGNSITGTFVLKALAANPDPFGVVLFNYAASGNPFKYNSDYNGTFTRSAALQGGSLAVTYDTTLAETATGVTDTSVATNAVYTVDSGVLSRTGYTFTGGWDTATAATTQRYRGGDTLTVTADTTFYPVWTPDTYTVTYDSATADTGTVPGSGTATYGTSFTTETNTGTLERTGYRFAGWRINNASSGTAVPVGDTFTVTQTAAITLYANWVRQYILTTSSGSNGSISAGGTFDSGTSTPITATPATGYELDAWSGCTSATTTCSVTMDQDRSVSVTFKAVASAPPSGGGGYAPPPPTSYNLNVTATGQGVVSPASGTQAANATISLSAAPRTGWKFSNWTGDCAGTTPTCSVTMNSDKNVGAVFVEDVAAAATVSRFPISVSVTGSGIVQVSPGQPAGGYPKDSVVRLTAAPRAGWSLDTWGGACSGSVEFCMVTIDGAKTITATFKASGAPEVVSAAWVQPQANGTSLVSWQAASGATQYLIDMNGKQVCRSTQTTCTIERLVGPRDLVVVRAANTAGTAEASEAASYVTASRALQLFTVNFAAGSSTLTAKARTALEKAIKQMKLLGYTELSIVGHTDNREAKAAALSLARAKSVAAFVGRALDVTFVTSGKAAMSPLTTNSTIAGRAANRRAVGFVR